MDDIYGCTIFKWVIVTWFRKDASLSDEFGGDIDGLVQDFSISSALAMELLQACTKSSIWLSLAKRQSNIDENISCDDDNDYTNCAIISSKNNDSDNELHQIRIIKH